MWADGPVPTGYDPRLVVYCRRRSDRPMTIHRRSGRVDDVFRAIANGKPISGGAYGVRAQLRHGSDAMIGW